MSVGRTRGTRRTCARSALWIAAVAVQAVGVLHPACLQAQPAQVPAPPIQPEAEPPQQSARPAQIPIVDFIETLRSRGLNVIYGSDMLPTSLVMDAPGDEDRGLGTLEAALRPYGLTLRAGPRRSWLVVRAPEAAKAEPAANEAATPVRSSVPVLESVVVSASRYAYVRSAGPSTTELDHDRLSDAPTFGSDAIRATHALPGLTSSGVTARVNVRGGDADESLLYIDGVRLYSPFHLKNYQSLFSSLSPELVDSMAVYSGAYPARFGDRMSGVFDIETVEPPAGRSVELGLSTLSSSILGMGRFADERGSWVGSLRRGNLDLLLDAADSNVGSPRYADGFGKIGFELSPDLAVVGGMLALNDEIQLNDGSIASSRTDYHDVYLWSGFHYTPGRFRLDGLVSRADLDSRRDGWVDDPIGSVGTLDERRIFRSTALKLDWTYALGDRQSLNGGLELRSSDADYDHVSVRTDRVPLAVPGLARPPAAVTARFGLDVSRSALYLTWRARPVERLTTEIGLRRDAQTLPADAQSSPRLSLLYDIGDRLSLRAFWGRFYQAQSLDELPVGDGVTSPYPAQSSEHAVLGIEYDIGAAVSMRIEAYRKELESLRPRFENLFGRLALLPELRPDRVMIVPDSGDATGLEISFGGGTDTWRWWSSLTRARVRDIVDGVPVARSWEEPLAVKGGMIRQGSRWTVSLAASWHTGWPISRLSLEAGGLVARDLNGSRLAGYSSVDVRATRHIELGRGSFDWFVALNNALAAESPCCLEYDVTLDAASRPQSLKIDVDSWMPIVPSAGFVWRLGRE